jgi:hypothetical protein
MIPKQLIVEDNVLLMVKNSQVEYKMIPEVKIKYGIYLCENELLAQYLKMSYAAH